MGHRRRPVSLSLPAQLLTPSFVQFLPRGCGGGTFWAAAVWTLSLHRVVTGGRGTEGAVWVEGPAGGSWPLSMGPYGERVTVTTETCAPSRDGASPLPPSPATFSEGAALPSQRKPFAPCACHPAPPPPPQRPGEGAAGRPAPASALSAPPSSVGSSGCFRPSPSPEVPATSRPRPGPRSSDDSGLPLMVPPGSALRMSTAGFGVC